MAKLLLYLVASAAALTLVGYAVLAWLANRVEQLR